MRKLISSLIISIVLFSCSAPKRVLNSMKVDTINYRTIKDSNSKQQVDKDYNQVVQSNLKPDSGLFLVHKINNKFLFEIPNNILGRDLLIVTRISKAAADIRPGNGMSGYAGDWIGENVVRFEKGPNKKIFLKRISFNERSYDSSENGMYHSVNNSNLYPIIASFDMKAYNPDSSAVLIDPTDYLIGDNPVFSFFNKSMFPISGIQVDKSYIVGVQSFPINLEVQTVKTFSTADGGFATYELNSSIVALPDELMKIRYYDPRVGYFARSYRDFDAPQGVKGTTMITRWNLQPKDEDITKYLRGELVEPKKPIVYFIDPSTPQKWVQYLIQGVNDWQAAFEQAGFKNAIYALEAPKEDPEWSLYDARHNAIVYKPSYVANATGPHIHDPRTGEILETHINWYHNVIDLLRNWYIIQAGPNDERGRNILFDDSLMGQLIRFACAHEVGHTLGLLHNFGSSSTVSVEKLRDKLWVEQNGFCPSIMDYARFNFVAQPEDKISPKDLIPRIGMYDKWAIEFGYRWFHDFRTKDAEKTYMNQWVINQLSKDKRFWYGPQAVFGGLKDSRCQSEDLGDNPMIAGNYGIQNLKRVLPQLINWARIPNDDYYTLEEIREELVKQYQRYLNHVVNIICVPMWTDKTVEQSGGVIAFSSKTKIREAVSFLHVQLFDTPTWLLNKEIFSLIGGKGKLEPLLYQSQILQKLISENTFSLLSSQAPSTIEFDGYTFLNLLSDLEKGIWKELDSLYPIDYFRRNLQKAYVDRMITAMTNAKASTDFSAILLFDLRKLEKRIAHKMIRIKDQESMIHLAFIRDKIANSLEIKSGLTQKILTDPIAFQKENWKKQTDSFISNLSSQHILNCWEDNVWP